MYVILKNEFLLDIECPIHVTCMILRAIIVQKTSHVFLQIAFNYILGSAVTSDFRSTQRELIYDRRDMRFLQVPIVQDDEVEDDETFFISMSISPSPNIEIAVPRIGVNIIDDDGVRGKQWNRNSFQITFTCWSLKYPVFFCKRNL